MIYRAELFPNLKATVHTWKEKCKEEGIPNLHVCMVQSFGQVDPTIYGCDSAVEFPPHGVYANEISKTMNELVPDFSGNIYDYREVVDRSLQKKKAGDFTWFRGTMLSWDNTARRKSAANVFHYANPVENEREKVGIPVTFGKREGRVGLEKKKKNIEETQEQLQKKHMKNK
ncbi:hypothetical protein E4V51_26190 [Paenibacillus sp. 28ISP30-2]|nr:hypothetical protein [Paenibacillus sp. 28ISP30-2]